MVLVTEAGALCSRTLAHWCGLEGPASRAHARQSSAFLLLFISVKSVFRVLQMHLRQHNFYIFLKEKQSLFHSGLWGGRDFVFNLTSWAQLGSASAWDLDIFGSNWLDLMMAHHKVPLLVCISVKIINPNAP